MRHFSVIPRPAPPSDFSWADRHLDTAGDAERRKTAILLTAVIRVIRGFVGLLPAHLGLSAALPPPARCTGLNGFLDRGAKDSVSVAIDDRKGRSIFTALETHRMVIGGVDKN